MATLDADQIHHQCAACHTVYHGPHAGANPGADVNIITDEGEMYLDPSTPERWNVSHGMCPDCLAEWQREARADLERRHAAKQPQE